MNTSSNIFDINQARQLLCAIFYGGNYVTVRPVESWTNQSGKKEHLIDWNGYWSAEANDFIGRLEDAGRRSYSKNTNIFFGVCPRISHDHQRAWQIRQVNCLWADVDNSTCESALKKCQTAHLPEPSIVIASGNGCHLYWLLTQPFIIGDGEPPPPIQQEWNEEHRCYDKFFEIDRERTYVKQNGKRKNGRHPITILSPKAAHTQYVMQGIAAAIGADHTHDLSRLLRLPGTLNVKNGRNGQPPTQCYIWSCDPAKRYEISGFDCFADLSPKKQKLKAISLPGPRRRTQKLNDKFNHRLNDCVVAQDRSQADFALLCEAIKQGRPKDEVWEAVKNTSKFAERGREYFNATWAAAEIAAKEDIAEAAELRESDCRYAATDSGLVYQKPAEFEVEVLPLTNFNATITSEITEVDDIANRKVFEIEASPENEDIRFTVPADEFIKLDWVHTKMGAQAIIYAGHQVRQHVVPAIQSLSHDITKRTVYKHLGWKKIGDRQVYLHAGGGIGANGPRSDVHVEADPCLANFQLPLPITDPTELKQAMNAVLALLEVAPIRITAPLFAALYRSVLGPADFSLFLHGHTETGKTELATLAQQHFGPAMTSGKLPLSWTSTENALEGVTFLAKDALIVIDDFVTKGDRYEIRRAHTKAERVLRAQANQQGRSRMRSDSSLRATKYPRGLIMSTGEELPEGQSLRNRLFLVEVNKGDVNWQQMTWLQQHSGEFSRVMSTYLQWLASFYDSTGGQLKSWTDTVREQIRFACGTSMRTPTVAAGLLVGAWAFADFARANAALAPPDWAAALYERIKAGVLESLQDQRRLQAEENPVDQYMSVLRAVVDSGAGHLCGTDGKEPTGSHLFGWRDEGLGAQAKGPKIGWVDGFDVYLIPEATHRAVQTFADGSQSPIGLRQNTMGRRLKEHGVLKTTDDDRASVRKSIAGKTYRCLHIDVTALDVNGEGYRQLLADGVSQGLSSLSSMDFLLDNGNHV